MKHATITDFYQKDHDRLEIVFKQFQNQQSEDSKSAIQAFQEFKKGLHNHIKWEEEILFPLFEDKTGMKEMGPTAVMRSEHEQIKTLLESIDQHAQTNHFDSNEEAELMRILSEHNSKEETILYPMIDQQVNEEELNQIYEKMDNI